MGRFANKLWMVKTVSIIEGSFTDIDVDFFEDLVNLESIKVDPNNTEYKDIDGVLYSKDGKKLLFYPQGKTSTSYTIPAGVTEIGDNAFEGCKNLTSITIPDSVTEIKESALKKCKCLEEIKVDPNNTEYKDIDGVVFSKDGTRLILCPQGKMGSYTIPAGVTKIKPCVFNRCCLEEIKVDPNNTEYKDIDGVVFSKDGKKLILCPRGKNGSYTIPAGVNVIEDSAFASCKGLTEITISDNVTKIGTKAFKNCENLTDVVLSKNLTTIEEDAFYGCKSLTNLDIPDSVTKIGTHAFEKCKNLTNVVLSKNLTTIENYAFWDCINLTELDIPDSVTKIGTKAFINCKNLTNVVLSKNLTTIGDFAFCNCSKLTELDIPDSVTKISPYAFKNCKSLTKVTLPQNKQFTMIKSGTFEDCSKLTELDIPDNVTNIKNSAFRDCKSLTKVILPKTVTSIGPSTFQGCSSLTSIKIPDELSIISDYTFAECSSLTSIEIPNKVWLIENHAFYNCSSLTSIKIPDTVLRLDQVGYDDNSDKIFKGCIKLESIKVDSNNTNYKDIDGVLYSKDGKKLLFYPQGKKSTSYTIPAGVTEIKTYAFNRCCLEEIKVDPGNTEYKDIDGVVFSKDGEKLISYPRGKDGSYTIPDGVTSIREAAFAECSNLTKLHFPDSVRYIGDDALRDCSKLTAVKFPQWVKNMIIPERQKELELLFKRIGVGG